MDDWVLIAIRYRLNRAINDKVSVNKLINIMYRN